MLDSALERVVRTPHGIDCFTESDPIQATLRAVLDGLPETEIVDLERDIEYLEMSGEVTLRLEKLLGLADESATLSEVA